MNYNIAIFDLDGTILNTIDDLKNSTNYALAHNGFPERTLNEVRQFVGNGIRKLIERAVPANTKADEINKVFSDFKLHYDIHCADNTKPYDGIMDMLIALRKSGCKTAVVSNKADFAVQKLCAQYFPGMFDSAVGERTGVNKKPAPDSVNEVLNQLGMSNTEAIYIGDSEVDIATANNANMPHIIVEWGFRDVEFLKKSGAETIVSTPEQIRKTILD